MDIQINKVAESVEGMAMMWMRVRAEQGISPYRFTLFGFVQNLRIHIGSEKPQGMLTKCLMVDLEGTSPQAIDRARALTVYCSSRQRRVRDVMNNHVHFYHGFITHPSPPEVRCMGSS